MEKNNFLLSGIVAATLVGYMKKKREIEMETKEIMKELSPIVSLAAEIVRDQMLRFSETNKEPHSFEIYDDGKMLTISIVTTKATVKISRPAPTVEMKKEFLLLSELSTTYSMLGVLPDALKLRSMEKILEPYSKINAVNEEEYIAWYKARNQ